MKVGCRQARMSGWHFGVGRHFAVTAAAAVAHYSITGTLWPVAGDHSSLRKT